MSKAYVLHSGGIDSTTCLYMAMKAFDEVVAVSIHYGQRHTVEINHAFSICQAADCRHQTVHMTEPPKSMLTDNKQEIPDVSYDDLPKGISPTYVPFRNGQMLSLLAGIAQDGKGDAIYFGAHAEDAADWAYPDCTPEFIGAMANAIYIGTYHQVRLFTPLQWMTKKDIIWLGSSLGVPWKLTWSCYIGGDRHCGVCPTCRSRRDGFIKAGIHDPTEYEKDVPVILDIVYILAALDSEGGYAMIAGPLPTIEDIKDHDAVAEGMYLLEQFNGINHRLFYYTKKEWHALPRHGEEGAI